MLNFVRVNNITNDQKAKCNVFLKFGGGGGGESIIRFNNLRGEV